MHSHFPESIFMNTLSWMTLVTKPISEISINLLAFYHECCSLISLRAGSLVWVGDKEPRTGEKNEARKSEPARELLIFEFRPSRGVKSAFYMCQITIQYE